jgi:hypothetical protein
MLFHGLLQKYEYPEKRGRFGVLMQKSNHECCGFHKNEAGSFVVLGALYWDTILDECVLAA